MNAEGLLSQATAPTVKAQLRANTEAAQSAGACGVPTVEIDGELIWGQDRLELVEAVLAGTWQFPSQEFR